MKTENSLSNEMKIFGKNIAYLRTKNNLSKTSMAKIMHVGMQTLNKIENGEIPKKMDIDVFDNVYKAFGIAPHEQLSIDLTNGTEA